MSIDQIARDYYSNLNYFKIFAHDAKGELITTDVLPALWQKVCEWASYAFALLRSGGGFLEERPGMPSLGLDRVRYRLFVTSEFRKSALHWAAISVSTILSNAGRELLGLGDHSKELQKFEHQNTQKILSVLSGSNEEKVLIKFEVMTLPSLFGNGQVDLSALCNASITMTPQQDGGKEEIIDLMQAKTRAQETVNNESSAK